MADILALPTPAKYKTGDIVVLKSGGPTMTVRYSAPDKGRNSQVVIVNWYVEGDNMTADFMADQLILFDDIPISEEEPQDDKEPA